QPSPSPGATPRRPPRVPSPPLILAPRFAGLVDRDRGERRERGFELLPEPPREILGGRVREPGHLVQVVVIELRPDRLHAVANQPVVEKPAGLRVHLPLDRDLDPEGVPVEPPALVTLRCLGEKVRGLEREILRQADTHQRSPTILWVCGMRRASG